MTPAPKIITKKASITAKVELEGFSFTRDMIPEVTDENLQAYRYKAWEAYQALPFPTRKDEAWRRTDIRGLNTTLFTLPNAKKQENMQTPLSRCVDFIAKGEERAGQIITGKVQTIRHLDAVFEEQGVVFVDFRTAEQEFPELLRRILGQIVSPDEDKFAALAAALAQDGVLLYVPKNVVIENPLHSLYCAEGEGEAYLNHLLIWLEEGAQATFVHESASPREQKTGQLLHSGIVEIHVGKRAQLNFVELQSWGKNVWSFTRERARVLEDGRLEWIFGAMGTHLTKNFSDVDLVEPGAFGRMSGFYFANGDQHLDHDTQQNHLARNTTSDLLYKGGLLDQSRSVWQGMIYVAPGAIGTDGYQANRNLILSKGARADSIPGLEILADDVRCTHGATVGRIDENELFYLLSRGIPRNEAEQLIVLGFFAGIMERIPFEGVKNRFTEAVREKMEDR
ncbi:MAG: Fe-S cluster assembly protein SufD [Brevefilum sp.]|nr:Fe-S cluster assembly protein SufD [Brevefilum sp.]